MFIVTSNVLGKPQITVQQTVADWRKFLGWESGTPPMMRPGQTVEAYDRIFGVATFVLAYGVASLQIGDAVAFKSGWTTVRTVAATRGLIGISMAANTDTTALSWFCIRGMVPGRAATMAVDAPLYATATAGSLSSTVVATNGVTGGASVLAASGTVTTKTIQTKNGSNLVYVPDLDGLYVGQAITGTGVPGSTTIAAIGEGGTMLGSSGPMAGFIQLSANCTADGSVTGTFAHPATFGTVSLNYPVMAGLG